MKSENISKHFHTLRVQRNQFLPELHSLSQEQLWHRKEDRKWSIGEHFYHLYLITRMLKVAIKFSFTLIPYAKLRRNTPFATEIHDIYAEYKEKHGRGMKAPWILIPSKKVYDSMNVTELEDLLSRETDEIKKLVQNTEENIAGHIVFLDPIAHYPNLIQSIQLLAIHEKHHFMIMKHNYEMIDTYLKI
ncbi:MULTISPECIES: DinB family protein [Bacillus]|uniref:DinB family protein n=1 Tax=Bacillus TaxID=1386 RepID=UPI0011A2B7F3|nr:DinB family protein [Bacillus mycoides]QWI77243.1 DinB family protein [Bacillus mycoides]HDR7564637.1 DinB family protein [Bacillus mycoides]HDR7615152.1 DinB family protein [Bacillus mycoides]